MSRKSISPKAEAELQAVLLRACERMERRQKAGLATEEESERLNEAVGTLKTAKEIA